MADLRVLLRNEAGEELGWASVAGDLTVDGVVARGGDPLPGLKIPSSIKDVRRCSLAFKPTAGPPLEASPPRSGIRGHVLRPALERARTQPDSKSIHSAVCVVLAPPWYSRGALNALRETAVS